MQPRDHYLAGLDTVRIAALCLVTVQHALTLSGHEDWTGYAGLSLGQAGVAIFVAVSGLLASDGRRPPVEWLLQRFRRLFPAYWLTLGVCFVLAAVTSHKSFGPAQVVSQFLGLGLFTHVHNLVNSPTWFVSLILVCYLGTCAARILRCPTLITVSATLILTVLVGETSRPWLLSHLMTYALASSVAMSTRKYRSHVSLFLAAVLTVLAVKAQPAFGYTALALLVIESAARLQQVPRFVRVLSEYSYEYYLIHGVALFGMMRLLPAQPLIACCCGIAIAAAAAFILRRVAETAARKTGSAIRRLAKRFPSGTAGAGTLQHRDETDAAPGFRTTPDRVVANAELLASGTASD